MSNPFGTIKAPAAVERFGGVEQGGLTTLISNGIVLVTMIGGIWVLFNILGAGLGVITAEGDPKKMAEMGEKIKNSFIGLLIMVAAPLISALIGLFFFGDATYFLKPTLTVVTGGAQ